MTITENTLFNGIELYFNTIPNKNIITALKDKKFKWHSVKKCWYAKATQENKDFAYSLTDAKEILTANTNNNNNKKETAKENNSTLELKSLTPLTQDEKIALAQKEWNTKSMQDYLLETYDFYKTQDNYIIEIEKASKLSITKELYYDDEYDAPQVNFDNFLAYNDRVFKDLEYLKEHTKCINDYLYILKNTNETCSIMHFTDWEIEDNKYGYFKSGIAKRPLTEEEKDDYIKILENRNGQFMVRLEKYFKRYGQHITTHGYWANR